MTRNPFDDARFSQSDTQTHARGTQDAQAGEHFFSPQTLWAELDKGLRAIERRVLGVKLPAALVHEVLDRVLLFINHVLLHEPQALHRLKRQQGRTLSLQWHDWNWRLRITRAGLLEREQALALAGSEANDKPLHLLTKTDLSIILVETSLLDVASRLMRDEKPALRIEGDVQLAAEVNWLVDHVQWDYEDDLSKIVGDAYAHQVVRVGHWALDAIRRFAGSAYARASTLAGGVGVK